MRHLSLPTVKGALHIISNENVADACQSCGVSEADWSLLTGKKVWLGVDRARIKRILDAILYGVVDQLGIPRFSLPAEYVGAVISMFVNEANMFSACNWLGNFAKAEDLADFHGTLEGVQGLETVSPAKLFALCLLIKSQIDVGKYRQVFANKTEIGLNNLKGEIKKDEKNEKSKTSK
jgi:hypothetical protein